MSNGVFFSKSLLISKAYSELSGSSIRILNYFYMKRRLKKVKNRVGKDDGWAITNNGEIIFTRKEAAGKGFSESTFKRSVDELIKVGLIDIDHQGTGLAGDCNRYSISDRWKLYGTDSFIVKKRQKQLRETKQLFKNR